MRNYALALLILTDLVMYLTKDMNGIDGGLLSFLLTLVVVVLVAFTSSALLRNSKSLAMTKNYTYSGVIGVILGFGFYFWVNSNIASLAEWFNEHGLTILLILNIICALTIFLSKKPKKKEAPLAA